MADDDLIRRGDALKVADEMFDRLKKKGAAQAAFGAAEVCEAIAALPAHGVGIRCPCVGRYGPDLKCSRCGGTGDAALAPAEAGGVEAHPYSLRPDLQRIVNNAKTAPQWDTERDCLAPTPDPVDALVKAAEALGKAREILIKHGYPENSILIGYLDAALAAIREGRNE